MSYLPLNSVRNITNPLAKLGGLAFDGVTSGSKDYHTIAAVGTSDISVRWSGVLPASNPTVTGILFCMSANTGTATIANSFYAAINTTGQLDVFFWGATTPTEYIRVLYSNIIATYGGKAVDIVFVRNATTPSMTVYINGIALSGGTETSNLTTWAMSINSTYLTLSQQAVNTPLNVTVFGAQLFNRALSASEVITLANQGVQEADKWGSLTALYGSVFTATADGWAANGGGSITLTANATDPAAVTETLKVENTSGGSVRMDLAKTISTLTPGKRYRVTAYIYNANIAGNPYFVFNTGGTASSTTAASSNQIAAGASGTVTIYITASSSTSLRVGTATSATGDNSTSQATGATYYIKTITVTQIGSILDADLSAGVGYQVPDRSSNNYHGLVSTSGTSWTLPIKNQKAIFTASSSGYLGDATSRVVIPSNARINSITAYSASGSTFSLGDDSAASTNLVSSVAISATTLTDLTLLKRYATTSTAGRIYVAFSVANSTTFTIDYSITATS